MYMLLPVREAEELASQTSMLARVTALRGVRHVGFVEKPLLSGREGGGREPATGREAVEKAAGLYLCPAKRLAVRSIRFAVSCGRMYVDAVHR